MNINFIKLCLTISLAAATLPSSSPAATLNLERPDFDIPDLGSSANRSISTAEESIYALQAVRELRGSQPTIEDPELNLWIQALGNRLAKHAPGGAGKYHFLIIKNPDINAYAMPGGAIAIYSGLILNTRSESELGAVIAHEIAHVSQRHIARMMEGPQFNPLVTGLGVLAGAAAARQNPQAGEAIITGTIASQIHNQLVFSQQMETEADRVGLRILAGAGLDPYAMSVFMEKLDRRNHDVYGNITQYLRTHPMSIDRLSDTRSRAGQMGKRPAHESADYLYAREKLRILTAPNAPPVAQDDPQLARYSQALRQLQGNPNAALQTLGTQSQHLPTALVIAQALNHTRQYAETEKLLLPLAKARPEREDILTLLGEAMLATNKAAQVWPSFNNVRLTEQTSLEFLETRQRVAEQAGQAAEAYRSAAERSVRMGEYNHARAVLEQATRIPGAPAQTIARMFAMIQEIDRAEAKAKQIDRL
ncbi:MAG: M48 family metalloprotease [Gammaproteobacteria bacterium]|nr:M48 family metalloprotease [Gammaproteobacteria bacterium]MBU1725055.1 M48 family metalloprotease [Gammaproteobacteria bacterium]MBU2007223.1 M48 family metalloprotease [Gammaproteobacteria bacterium]